MSVSYDAFIPLAEAALREICEEARVRWGQTLAFTVLHRTGTLQIGETSVLIAVNSAHRAEAFEACRHVIEEIKVRVPIWKKETYIDGESAWLKGHELCQHAHTPASDEERYSPQIRLPGFGLQGQARLRGAKVLCVGLGGLGSPSALYLAAAGVGTLGIIDPDTVSLSNLQRQILYTSSDLGKPKVLAARNRLLALNPECRVTAYQGALTPENARSIMEQYDLVLDGTDDLDSKFLINDTASQLGLPWIMASVTGFDAQIACFAPGEPDYRSIFRPDPGSLAQDCTRAGVIGALAGMIGARQAFEAVSWIASGLGPRKATLSTIETGLARPFEELSLEIPRREPEEIPPRTTPQGVVIDVRSEAEWHSNPREGALHWPLSRLEAGQFPDLPAETPIVLACKSGVRARQAQVLMAQKGYFSTSCL